MDVQLQAIMFTPPKLITYMYIGPESRVGQIALDLFSCHQDNLNFDIWERRAAKEYPWIVGKFSASLNLGNCVHAED